MVAIPPPPPARPPTPLFSDLPAGTRLLRIYTPAPPHGAGPLAFRHFGPLSRFDHQPGAGVDSNGAPRGALAPDRGIQYLGFTLSCCVVEVFGDAGTIECGVNRVADLTLTRPVHLLDVRGRGAMRAGSVAALSKVPDRRDSQVWGRFFYDRMDLYCTLDGLRFDNAHNDEDAVALYERAAPALALAPDSDIPLAHPVLRPRLEQIAIDHGLILL